MPGGLVASVVCATYRRPAGVARLLDALARQDVDQPFEVVLVDDGSGADVVEEVKALVRASPLRVQLLLSPHNRGPAAARNSGWRAAQAPVVAFIDDDCQPAPDWLRAGLQAMAPGGLVVVGKVVPDPDQAGMSGPWSRTLEVSSARHFQTANALYQRADLEEVGGFDERFSRAGGEDTDLGLRVLALGRDPVFAKAVLVRHDVRAGTPLRLAMDNAKKWVDLPLVLRKHPQLRDTLHHRVFWKRSHPLTIVALAGLLGFALRPTAFSARRATQLSLPWVFDRALVHRPGGGRYQRLAILPGTFLVDAGEVAACVRGSVRHRTLLL